MGRSRLLTRADVLGYIDKLKTGEGEIPAAAIKACHAWLRANQKRGPSSTNDRILIAALMQGVHVTCVDSLVNAIGIAIAPSDPSPRRDEPSQN